MRIIALAALALAASIGGAAAQQQQLTAGQRWVVAQEAQALSSPNHRLAVMSLNMAQQQRNHQAALRQVQAGRPQRQMR